MPQQLAQDRVQAADAQRWAGDLPPNVQVDAVLESAEAAARLVRFDLGGGPREDAFRNEERFWLDLSLSPRPRGLRARFVNRWARHRFQKVGSVTVFPPGEPLQIRCEGGFQSALICELPRDAVSNWLEHDFDWTNQGLEAVLNVSDVNLRNALVRLGREMRKPGLASGMMIELIMGQLALELGRYCAAIEHRAADHGGLAGWRLRRIDERLEEMGAPPTLAELAKLCGLSPRQLSRGFRASRGCSIGEYAAQKRIEFARRRLESADSVGEVAWRLGFATASNFIQAFRRETGMTPGQYREQLARRI